MNGGIGYCYLRCHCCYWQHQLLVQRSELDFRVFALLRVCFIFLIGSDLGYDAILSNLILTDKRTNLLITTKQKNMKKANNQLILLKDDYDLMKSLMSKRYEKILYDRRNSEELSAELKKAKLVGIDEFPHDVVRLNSMVKVKTEGKNEIIELVLVTPDKADIKERKISIMAPIGMALIGFRQGQTVKWKVPAGKRNFTIVEVINDL
jgi:regulator of nucleoside diphosphate kinase